ncbi:hypothetical protein ACQ4M3_02590 [Leptolyngbya sp. AN03gr2]|uniref:hypothetical protein n=1 Tax=unclassified Leptolyngbya TaxID=2650499 RepID=UPI003D316F34
MAHLRTIQPLSIAGILSLSMLAGVMLKAPSVQAQTPGSGSGQARPISPNDPNVVRPTPAQGGGLLSLQGGQRLMDEADQAVKSQNLPVAMKKLQEARQVYNQLSNFYQELAASFSGVDTRVADSQRTKALEAAQLRDQATYRLALVHRAMNQSELAVPLLVQIIRSQQPTRDLGKQAYQQLLEMGFVDVAYPRTADQPTNQPANR